MKNWIKSKMRPLIFGVVAGAIIILVSGKNQQLFLILTAITVAGVFLYIFKAADSLSNDDNKKRD